MPLRSLEDSWNSITEIDAPADEVWQGIATRFSIPLASIPETNETSRDSLLEVELFGRPLTLRVLLAHRPRRLILSVNFNQNSARMVYLLTEVGGKTQVDESGELSHSHRNDEWGSVVDHLRGIIRTTFQSQIARPHVSSDFQGRPAGMDVFAIERLAQIGIVEGKRFDLWKQHWQLNPRRGFWSSLREAERLAGIRNYWQLVFQHYQRVRREKEQAISINDCGREIQGKMAVLRKRMEESLQEDLATKENEELVGHLVNIVETSCEFLSATEDVYKEQANHFVTFEGERTWSSKIPHQDISTDEFEYRNLKWKIEDIGPFLENRNEPYPWEELPPLRPGEEYWILTFESWRIGCRSWASGVIEVWLWNGQEAVFVETRDSWIS